MRMSLEGDRHCACFRLPRSFRSDGKHADVFVAHYSRRRRVTRIVRSSDADALLRCVRRCRVRVSVRAYAGATGFPDGIGACREGTGDPGLPGQRDCI